MTFISRRDLLKRAAFAAAAVPVFRRSAEAFALHPQSLIVWSADS